MKLLPPYLMEVLRSVVSNAGDDIEFALGSLCGTNASSYVSKLKRRGLAYTHRSNRTTEVWPTRKGIALIETTPTAAPSSAT